MGLLSSYEASRGLSTIAELLNHQAFAVGSFSGGIKTAVIERQAKCRIQPCDKYILVVCCERMSNDIAGASKP